MVNYRTVFNQFNVDWFRIIIIIIIIIINENDEGGVKSKDFKDT